MSTNDSKKADKTVDSFRILAKGVQRSNDTLKTGLNNNDLIIGASNSGKTSSYAEPNLAAAQNSMIVADSKGQLYKRYHKYLKDIGFEVHHLDFVPPEQSECYNPLDYIKRKTEEYIDENGEVQTRETYRQADVKKMTGKWTAIMNVFQGWQLLSGLLWLRVP